MHALVRPATSEDATGWETLRTQLWPDADSASEIAEYFAADPNERGQVLVAEDKKNGALCGFIELSVRRDWVEGSTSSPVAYVEGWFVHPDHRKTGIGKALLTAAEAWARDSSFTEIASDTLIDNEDSISAHLACGYVEVERTVHFIKPLRLTVANYLDTAPQDEQYVQALGKAYGSTNFCCPVHQAPLEIVDAYRTDIDFLPIPGVHRARRNNPHYIHIGQTFHADEFFDIPCKIVYCPVCQANYLAALAADPNPDI
jgi:aminoglycoside 6'-N-acetyltransferase I